MINSIDIITFCLLFLGGCFSSELQTSYFRPQIFSFIFFYLNHLLYNHLSLSMLEIYSYRFESVIHSVILIKKTKYNKLAQIFVFHDSYLLFTFTTSCLCLNITFTLSFNSIENALTIYYKANSFETLIVLISSRVFPILYQIRLIRRTS